MSSCKVTYMAHSSTHDVGGVITIPSCQNRPALSSGGVIAVVIHCIYPLEFL